MVIAGSTRTSTGYKKLAFTAEEIDRILATALTYPENWDEATTAQIRAILGVNKDFLLTPSQWTDDIKNQISDKLGLDELELSPESWDENTKQGVREAIGISFNDNGSVTINGITFEPLGTTKF